MAVAAAAQDRRGYSWKWRDMQWYQYAMIPDQTPILADGKGWS